MLLNHVDGVLEVLIDVAVKRSLERDEHNTIFFSPITCQKSHSLSFTVVAQKSSAPPTHHLERLSVALSRGHGGC